MIVAIHWNKFAERWILTDTSGCSVGESRNTKIFNAKYPTLSKDKLNIYNDRPSEKLKEIDYEYKANTEVTNNGL